MLSMSPGDRFFVLTGAGVSAESGIPTFRGVKGLWRNYRIEEVASPHAWRRDPRLVWAFYSILRALDACTVFLAIGTSGVVEPAASFVAHVQRRARTIYVGPEEPANRAAFSECHFGMAGEVLAKLFQDP